jgi:ribosomal protein S18 acetylase RimI-like enzyme
MPLKLVEMDPDDFARRRGPAVATYARAIMTSRGLTAAEAAQEAERTVYDHLPRGSAARSQLLRKAMVDGTEVGWIWVSLPGPTRPGMAWISNIEVDPDFRSRGYAAEMITATAADLIDLGVPRLALNVFGDNEIAARLYRRLGFEVTAQQYSRALTEIPPAAGVELVPIVDYETRIAALFADYAQDLVHEQGLWHGEAEAEAARKQQELLPRGDRTSDTILRTVLADGRAVGWLWAGRPPVPARPELSWLHHIELDEPHRNRGHGRGAIAAIEAEVAGRGASQLGLNVHGSNTGARRLYQRLGYGLLAQQMARNLER